MRNLNLSPSADTQRGAALLLFVIALVLSASYMLLKKINQSPNNAARDAYTLQQLNTARDALLGYALHGLGPVGTTIKPGRLPCPDYMLDGNLDGDSDICVIISSHVQPGRLPWRTLGLAELRDANNEPLWYIPAIELDGSTPINSNIGTTLLRIDSGTDPLVAVVLAPGAALGTQTRPPGNPVAQLDPARYFEDVNALGGTDYVTVPASNTTAFNDRLLTIRLDRFMPELERRVLRELAGLLGNTPPFPNPAPAGTKVCDSVLGIKEGLIPSTCAAVAPPAFPSWFEDDEWQSLIWYAMDSSGSLTISPAGSAQALLFSPGRPFTGQLRPAADASHLLEDGLNTDQDTTYMQPVNSPTNNDQLLIVAP